MNLALGAIFLAILLLPPLLFFIVYRSSRYATPAPKFSILEYFLLSSVISIVLHSAIIYLFKLDVNFVFLIKLVSGNSIDYLKDDFKTNQKLERYIIGFAFYIFSVCLFGILLGLVFRTYSTSRKIRIYRLFHRQIKLGFINIRFKDDIPHHRYFNSWWYYFRINEYRNEYKFLGQMKPIVYVDVLVEVNNSTVIYKGILNDFITNGDDLDRIYLSNTEKSLTIYNLDQITIKTGISESIKPSGLICIPYESIKNLQIRFVKASFVPSITSNPEMVGEIVNSLNEDEINRFNSSKKNKSLESSNAKAN